MMGTWNIASGGRGWRSLALGLLAAIGVLSAVAARPLSEEQDPELPIRVIQGAAPGPTIALVAGVHGGKRAAVAALDSFAKRVDPARLRGKLIIVSPANVAGYRARLAQLSPDGLNLNRVFPGRIDGQPTERVAARIMRDVVAKSDYLIDLHGSDGTEQVSSFAYAARPGLDARVDSVAFALALMWSPLVIVRDEDGPRSLAESRFLQTAAHVSGVPAITVFEGGSDSEDLFTQDFFLHKISKIVGELTGRPVVVPQPGFGSRWSSTRQPHMDHPDEDVDTLLPSPRFSYVFPRRQVLSANRSGTWSPSVVAGQELGLRILLGTFTDSLGKVDSLRIHSYGIALHVRLAARVTAGTPLVIAAVGPDTLYTR